MSLRAAIILFALAIAAAGSARAEILSPLLTRPDSALVEAVRATPGIALRLDDAVGAALAEATTVREARAALMAARGSLRRERGAFDPELFADATKSSEEQANASASPFSSVPVVRDRETAVNGGARLRLPIGTELSASLETTRRETSSDFVLLNPEYRAAGKVEITQPLLKGFGPSAWSGWKSAGREHESARARYEDAVLATRTRVEQAYWDLHAAVRDYGVEKVIRDGAASLLNEAELRARAGLIGPSQVASARVFLAEREQLLLDREEQLDAISDQLATLMGRRPGDGQVRYLAADDPPGEFALEPLDTLLARATARNQGLRAAERDVEAARVRARGSKWDMLPQLDFIGSIGGTGLAGRRVPFYYQGVQYNADPSFEGDFGNTWTRVRNRDLPTWSAGVRVLVPIGFRAGAGEHERFRGELERAVQRLLATRRALEEHVRAAHRDMLHAKKRVEAARTGADASLEQVRIGLLEFRAGRVSAFELVRLAGDVATAQQRYSAALVRAAKTAAELRRLTAGADAAGAR
jgi:outer membrane protein TolC